MSSNMSPRQALLAAADHIQTNPQSYSFGACHTPKSLDDGPACMVGWACHFVGSRGFSMDTYPFFGKYSPTMWSEMCDSTSGAQYFARRAAKALRRYADKHFPYFDPYQATTPVWAVMRDREAQARIDAQPAYDRFRTALQLETVPQGEPGNSLPTEPAEDGEVL